MSDPANLAVAEIVRVHKAIMDWITGRMPEAHFEDEIADHLDPAFRIVEPGGKIVARDAVLAGLRSFHGGNPDFRILIDEAEAFATSGRQVLVSYIERQTGAAKAARTNARRSTALVDVGAKVRLLHLHETWIADDTAAAG
ncbi:MAG: hypothetical protein AAFR35_01560 [Pseudomonadota bacterium]